LWRVQTQKYVTSAIQNIEILIKHNKPPKRAEEMVIPVEIKKDQHIKVPHLTIELFNDVLRSTILAEAPYSGMATM
jgi:hypothetical protein